MREEREREKEKEEKVEEEDGETVIIVRTSRSSHVKRGVNGERGREEEREKG